jgi:hypothetical protein
MILREVKGQRSRVDDAKALQSSCRITLGRFYVRSKVAILEAAPAF